MKHFPSLFFASCLGVIFGNAARAADNPREALWTAVRAGDVKAVEAALDKGAEINARSEIGVTALWIACSKGNLEVIDLLVRRGADVNARDDIWYQTPLSQSANRLRLDIVKVLVKAGAKDVDGPFMTAVLGNRVPMAQALLDSGRVSPEALNAVLTSLGDAKGEARDMLIKAGAKTFAPITEADKKAWTPFAGEFETEYGTKVKFELLERGLALKRGTQAQYLIATGPNSFRAAGLNTTYTFNRQGDQFATVTLRTYTAESTLYRAGTKNVAVAPAVAPQVASGRVKEVLNWPQFRGQFASGVADGQEPPLTWDIKTGAGVLWKTPIPGLGHSCPIVWGERVFVTTAVSENADPKIRIGNYGDVGSVNDTTKHTWHLLCLDRTSGKILWDKKTFEGVPKIKRHLKGSQANCTPVTDGKRIVACFGSEGMYCFDFAGKLLWKRDLGTLDSSFAIDVNYEWGFGSSPIIHNDLVILQCDVGKDSFIAAYRLDDGSQAWSTPRDEIPSWSSPTIWHTDKRVEIVTNAAQYARGYDPETGKELWRLAKKSEVTIPTPVVSRELAYITSGNRPIQPIYAIRPGAMGDISLTGSESHNKHVQWSRQRGGPYMPSPILYRGHYYTCGNSGMVTCYEAATGKEIYKERIGGDSYTASPVAADGRMYFAAEAGQVRVVKAGPEFGLLAVNDLGDYIMATPAISGGILFVRSQHYLWALGMK